MTEFPLSFSLTFSVFFARAFPVGFTFESFSFSSSLFSLGVKRPYYYDYDIFKSVLALSADLATVLSLNSVGKFFERNKSMFVYRYTP